MRAASARRRSRSGTAAASRRSRATCSCSTPSTTATAAWSTAPARRCSCARRDLPRQGAAETGDGYVTLLGLIWHEYFHTWNVKRLKPREFARIDFSRENYTRLLWFFEGFTSYYDDLLLLRAGLIDAPRYLRLLAKTLSGVLATPGAGCRAWPQASFDAWVKYYRSDENTPNATDQLLHQGLRWWRWRWT